MSRWTLMFLAGVVLFEIAYVTTAGGGEYLAPYLEASARWAGNLLRVSGVEVSSYGTLLSSGSDRVEVRRGCDGVQTAAFFAIAVLVFPVPLRARALALAVGIPAIVGLNVLRIAGLFVVHRDFPEHFHTFHHSVFPLVLILSTLVPWFVWARWAMRRYAAPAS